MTEAGFLISMVRPIVGMSSRQAGVPVPLGWPFSPSGAGFHGASRPRALAELSSSERVWQAVCAEDKHSRQHAPSGQQALPDARPEACRPPQTDKQRSRLCHHKTPGALMDLGCSAPQVVPSVGRTVVSVSRGAWSCGPALDPCQNLYQKRR